MSEEIKKKKKNTKKTSVKNKSTNKPKTIKKEKLKESKVKEEKVVEKENIEVKEPVKKKRKKKSYVLLGILGCVILFLIFASVIVFKWYLPSEKYTFDYFSLRTIDYSISKEQDNKLVSDNGKCMIVVANEIKKSKDDDISKLGEVVTIKHHDWAKQEFSTGYTWISYYKNMTYIIQMYANDEETFNDVCKKDFDQIKKSFSFLKDE